MLSRNCVGGPSLGENGTGQYAMNSLGLAGGSLAPGVDRPPVIGKSVSDTNYRVGP